MEPIAIIGASCRLPGAPNIDAFWQMLRRGGNAVTEVPPGRWDARAVSDSQTDERRNTTMRWGGFLERVDEFDATFFGISPAEASTLDPQQRLLLETAWEALEDAGQTVEQLATARTGVFVGIGPGDYGRLALKDLKRIESHTNTGNFISIAANRISYVLDLHGPSIALDTACSSSLVAVHLACQSLSTEECEVALAGGVNVILSPDLGVGLSQSGALSSDGQCKAFDAHADGYVRSEGVGLVILKPLARALADADPIYAVIRGSAVNQNGRTNGLTAPSRRFQEAVLRDACRSAGVSPAQVQYVEAHASSTLLGDLIEAEALSAVYGAARPAGSLCLIGSAKTNLGHLETASGITSLIKTALALKHREIPPSLHFKEPNPHIPFDNYRLKVQTTLGAWPESRSPAMAAVSAFGLGGTNAHMILEESPRHAATETTHVVRGDNQAFFLPLSARTQTALHSLARAYLHFLTEEVNADTFSLGDMCYTASLRRSHHDYRASFVFHSLPELRAQLAAYLQGELPDGVAAGRRPTTVRQHQLNNRDTTTAGLSSALDEEAQKTSPMASLGRSYVLGGKIDWREIFPHGGRYLRLPSYPWQRQRHWLSPEDDSSSN
ncbi:MAG TPA: beta-ketoacyl synthase N-terminal-like domain-containing protein [Pyrinomonadaceae bacterium]